MMSAINNPDGQKNIANFRQTIYATTILLLTLGLSNPSFAAGRAEPGALRLQQQNNVEAIPQDVANSLEDSVTAAKTPGKTSAELVVAPLPSRNPLLG
jgi:hypothetical protein